MENTELLKEFYSEELYDLPPKVVILLNKSWKELSSEETGQLYKILGAIKIKPETVQIIKKNSIDLQELDRLNSSAVISFGCTFHPELPKHEIAIRGITQIVCSDPIDLMLDTIPDSKQSRLELWNALKEMFLIKKA